VTSKNCIRLPATRPQNAEFIPKRVIPEAVIAKVINAASLFFESLRA
jgi:hypothetical protein